MRLRKGELQMQAKDVDELPILLQLEAAWDKCFTHPDPQRPIYNGVPYPCWCLLKGWGLPPETWGNVIYSHDPECHLKEPEHNLHHAFGPNYGLHVPWAVKMAKMEQLEKRGLVDDINGESYVLTKKGKEYLNAKRLDKSN